ncbi:hypothetical protein SAMN04487936_11432 [Halobacillus dabanensis]|uniref:Nucleotidyltransferase domain-containing protein n=1 Tax=Halobacillus dabanensis TaxID=240302 RepID=A0A1I3ZL87_HALDA|nr:hypothetical protein SAMN04487936_11432 [Halobacillus dabanensis]
MMMTAGRVIQQYYSSCDAALLAGSGVREEATTTSDLDIVIFDEKVSSSYRESFFASGWPVEVFVHNWTSYLEFFRRDCLRGIPSMPRMVVEGKIVKNDSRLRTIKEEAEYLLDEGPLPWSKSTIDEKRYFLTDAIEDLIGCTDRGEEIFIAGKLAEQVSEFYLRVNRQWIGSSKWAARALRNYDRVLADQLIGSFDELYKQGEKGNVIRVIDEVLAPYGGRLFEGFSIGKS